MKSSLAIYKPPLNCISSMLRCVTCVIVIISLFACTNSYQIASADPELSIQDRKDLVLETKQAILDLNFALVDKLSARADVNRMLPDQSSLLAWAVETQEPKLVRMMLEKGAKAQVSSGNRFTPIIQACRYGNPDIINMLLDYGANPNSAIEDGTSAFQLCAGSAATEILATMVSKGANVIAQNNAGQTALMWSANFGKVDNLHFLMSEGANINQKTKEGYSPLLFAIKSHNLDAVKAALSYGADVLVTTKDGTTAAQLAVYTKNYSFLNWFVSELDSLMSSTEQRKTLTAFDRNGHQLLHAAVHANQVQLVSNLLALGANSDALSAPSALSWRYEANFKTENYYPPQLTPLEIANEQNFQEIVAVLND